MRLKKAVLAWIILWGIIGVVIYAFATHANASKPKIDCHLTAWKPHQIPGPRVEYDGEWNCNSSHYGTITVVGLVDGYPKTNYDGVVCIGTHCPANKVIAKFWGCHHYITMADATIDGVEMPTTYSGVWDGCR